MKKVTKLWKQKSGQNIRICDMDDKHLVNTIKLLVRAAEKQKWSVPYPNFNGEMAQYYAEQEWDNLMENDGIELASQEFPIFDYLCQEAERRKIEVYDLIYSKI